MNRDELLGDWNQIKGKVREKWGDLTDDDLDRMEGKREQLIGKIQERYGKAREDVEREVDEFAKMWRDSTRH